MKPRESARANNSGVRAASRLGVRPSVARPGVVALEQADASISFTAY